MAPSMASAWPTMYFVQAEIETETPCSNGLKYNPVAQVLSMITGTPRLAAAAAMAGMSCISNVSEPGLSVKTSAVLSWMRSAMPAPIRGS